MIYCYIYYWPIYLLIFNEPRGFGAEAPKPRRMPAVQLNDQYSRIRAASAADDAFTKYISSSANCGFPPMNISSPFAYLSCPCYRCLAIRNIQHYKHYKFTEITKYELCNLYKLRNNIFICLNILSVLRTSSFSAFSVYFV